MPIVPVRELIPENIDQEVVPILNGFADTISECVNFASNIFVWEKFKTHGEENVPPVMLLRHAIELMDSLALLIRNSHSESAKLQLRSLAETHFKLLYMLDADTDERAMAFLVENILRDINDIGRILKMEEEQRKTKKSKGGFIIDESSPINLQEVLDGKKSLLENPKYQKAFQEFTRIKGNGKTYPAWHRCYGGPANVRDIAVKLDLEEFYKNVYKTYSNYIHGMDIYSGKMTGNSILQIRLPQQAQKVSRFALYLFLGIIKKYIEKRVPHTDKDFKAWFPAVGDKINKSIGATERIR